MDGRVGVSDGRAERLARLTQTSQALGMYDLTEDELRERVCRYHERIEALEARLRDVQRLYRAYDATTHDMYSNNLECVPDCPRCAALNDLLGAVAALAGGDAPPPAREA